MPESTIPPRSTEENESRSSKLGTAAIPRMGAEAGFEVVRDESLPPLRWSGFFALILGLLSFSATVAYPMVVVPLLAILIGLFALRRHDGPRPVGTTPAVIGIVLASGFGACGLAIHQMKRSTLASQAEYFARQYIEVCENGDVPLAMELQRNFYSRQSEQADLDKIYATDERLTEQVEQFEMGAFSELQRLAGKADWVLAEPVRVYQQYGYEKADTYWIDASGNSKQKLHVQLSWTKIRDQDRADWNVTLFQWYRERIVAPSIV